MDINELFSYYGIPSSNQRFVRVESEATNDGQQEETIRGTHVAESPDLNTNVHALPNPVPIPPQNQPENQTQQIDQNQSSIPIQNQILAVDQNQNPILEENRPSYAAATVGLQAPTFNVNSLPEPELMGEYPAVTLSARAVEKGMDYCKYALLGRMDVKKIGLEKIRKIAEATWKPSGDWVISPIGKGFLFIRFDNSKDYNFVWTSASTWMFEDEPMRLSKWTPNFSQENQKQTHAMVWVRMPGLSQEYWAEESLLTIAKGVGHPLKVDEKSMKRSYGYFAQVLVDVDFAKPVPAQVLVRTPTLEFWQTVVIPKFPKICNHCRVVGHLVHECTLLHNDIAPREREINRDGRTIQTGDRRGQMQQDINFQRPESSARGEQRTGDQPVATKEHANRNEWQVQGRNNGRNNNCRTNRGNQNRQWIPRNNGGSGSVPPTNRFHILQREEGAIAEGAPAQLGVISPAQTNVSTGSHRENGAVQRNVTDTVRTTTVGLAAEETVTTTSAGLTPTTTRHLSPARQGQTSSRGETPNHLKNSESVRATAVTNLGGFSEMGRTNGEGTTVPSTAEPQAMFRQESEQRVGSVPPHETEPPDQVGIENQMGVQHVTLRVWIQPVIAILPLCVLLCVCISN